MGTVRKLQIGNVTLENNLILAPMAGVTDLPFRLLCKEQGAGLLCMEMVSAKAILYKNKNTEELLTIDPRENPVSLQLFGSDPDIMSEIAKQIEERPFDILDIIRSTLPQSCCSHDSPLREGAEFPASVFVQQKKSTSIIHPPAP